MRSTKGQLQCSRGAKVGSTCRIVCPLGTRLRSYKNDDAINPSTQISIVCLESRKWTASRFIDRESNSWQCVERSCPPLHRKSSSSDIHYKLVRFICMFGVCCGAEICLYTFLSSYPIPHIVCNLLTKAVENTIETKTKPNQRRP